MRTAGRRRKRRQGVIDPLGRSAEGRSRRPVRAVGQGIRNEPGAIEQRQNALALAETGDDIGSRRPGGAGETRILDGVLCRFVGIIVVDRTVVAVMMLDAVIVLDFMRQICGQQLIALQRKALQGKAHQQQ